MLNGSFNHLLETDILPTFYTNILLIWHDVFFTDIFVWTFIIKISAVFCGHKNGI